MLKKRTLLVGTLAAAFIALTATGVFYTSKGEANAPSPIPVEVQPIINKMMDSVDHYKFVSAIVQYDFDVEPDRTVSIAAKFEPKVKVKSQLVDEQGNLIKQFQNNSKLLTVNTKNSTYAELTIDKSAENGWKKRPDHRLTHRADGKFHATPRMSPFHTGLGAENVLYPQDCIRCHAPCLGLEGNGV